MSAKEVVYLLNVSSRDYIRHSIRSLPWVLTLQNSLPFPQKILVCSVEFEQSIEEEKAKGEESYQYFLAANPAHVSTIEKIIKELYLQLDLISFYVASPAECKVYFVPQGTMVPEAGGLVDSENER